MNLFSLLFLHLLDGINGSGHGHGTGLECAEEKLFNFLSTSYNNRFVFTLSMVTNRAR